MILSHLLLHAVPEIAFLLLHLAKCIHPLGPLSNVTSSLKPILIGFPSFIIYPTVS